MRRRSRIKPFIVEPKAQGTSIPATTSTFRVKEQEVGDFKPQNPSPPPIPNAIDSTAEAVALAVKSHMKGVLENEFEAGRKQGRRDLLLELKALLEQELTKG
jgi:hypothetical protein